VLKFQKCSSNLKKDKLSLFGFVLSIPEPPHSWQELMTLIFKEDHFSILTAVFCRGVAHCFFSLPLSTALLLQIPV